MKKLAKKDREKLEKRILAAVEDIKKHSIEVKKCFIDLYVDYRLQLIFWDMENIPRIVQSMLEGMTQQEGKNFLADYKKFSEIATDTASLWGKSEFVWKERALFVILMDIKEARTTPFWKDSSVDIYPCIFSSVRSVYNKYPRQGIKITISFDGVNIASIRKEEVKIYPNEQQALYQWHFSESAKRYIVQEVEQNNSFSCPEI